MKIPNEHNEKVEEDDELDKLQNIGHMWKNDQEKFSPRLFYKILFSVPQLQWFSSLSAQLWLSTRDFCDEIELMKAFFDIQFNRINTIETWAIPNHVRYFDGYYKWRAEYFIG